MGGLGFCSGMWNLGFCGFVVFVGLEFLIGFFIKLGVLGWRVEGLMVCFDVSVSIGFVFFWDKMLV